MAGSAKLTDDRRIPDEESLYRSILPEHVKPDEDRPSSAAFFSSTDPDISVDRASLSSPRETLQRRPGATRVAELQAGRVRATENVAGVASCPVPGNPAHALIFCEDGVGKSAWHATARKLAKASTWAALNGR
jgi:hypothetical protein